MKAILKGSIWEKNRWIDIKEWEADFTEELEMSQESN